MFSDEFTYDRDITELADELGQFGAQVRPAVVLARATSTRQLVSGTAQGPAAKGALFDFGREWGS